MFVLRQTLRSTGKIVSLLEGVPGLSLNVLRPSVHGFLDIMSDLDMELTDSDHYSSADANEDGVPDLREYHMDVLEDVETQFPRVLRDLVFAHTGDKVVHVDQFLVLRGRLLRELSHSDLETIRARLEHTLPQAISRLISSTLS